MVDLLSRHRGCTGPTSPPGPSLFAGSRPLFAVGGCEHGEPWWWNGDRWLPGDGTYQPVYRTGLRGWWRHARLNAMGSVPWRHRLRRMRPSARLRQCDIERDYWKRIVLGHPHGADWGHPL